MAAGPGHPPRGRRAHGAPHLTRLPAAHQRAAPGGPLLLGRLQRPHLYGDQRRRPRGNMKKRNYVTVSVADPGCLSRIRIFSIPDSGPASKNLSILTQIIVSKLSEI
jgi:hypothetical protein